MQFLNATKVTIGCVKHIQLFVKGKMMKTGLLIMNI